MASVDKARENECGGTKEVFPLTLSSPGILIIRKVASPWSLLNELRFERNVKKS